MSDVADLVVAITGGARGIGLATAQELAEGGAHVHIGDLDGGLARDEADRLGLAGGHAVDVVNRASFAAFLDVVRDADGPLDGLVNNAGVMPWGAFLDEDTTSQEQTVAVNLTGVINGMRLALPEMVERRRGHVVNVSSLAARVPLPGSAVYSGTKAAVVAMTDAVRRELAGTGVELTTVLPTQVATDLASGAPSVLGLQEVQPDEVAATVARALGRRGGNVVAGPWWLDPLTRLAGIVPRRLEDLVRRVVGDDRLLTGVDTAARAAYVARIAADRERGVHETVL